MASQHRKYRGYESQRLVAEYLQEHGFPFASSTGAGRSGSDVIGTIGIDWEVKARRGFNPLAAMKQLTERAEDGVIPVAVLRPDGMGASSVSSWPVVMPLFIATWLLREAGYGEPNPGGVS